MAGYDAGSIVLSVHGRGSAGLWVRYLWIYVW